MFTPMLRWVPFAVALISVVFLAGCGGAGGNNGQPDPTVRFLNASPDSVALEFLLNDNVVETPKAYLESTPNFVAIEPEILDVTLRETGTTFEFWSEAINFTPDTDHLIVAIGLENFNNEFEKRIRITNVNVNRERPIGNKARVYVVHGYLREVGFQTPNIDFQTPGNNPLFKLADISFANSKNIEVDSGTQTYEVRRLNTQNILASATVTLDAGKIYVAVFSGVENAAPPQEPKITFIELQSE